MIQLSILPITKIFTFIETVKLPNNSVYFENTEMSFSVGRYNQFDFVNIGKVMDVHGFYYSLNDKSVKTDNFELLCCK